jgi:hypothetical protein
MLLHTQVAGHSAGGQFVQRWALLSNSPVWKSSPGDDLQQQSPFTKTKQQRAISIRAIPANPRCFAFLDDRRFVTDNARNNATIFQKPSANSIAQCPDYNEWIWGLDHGGNITDQYKDYAMKMAGGAKRMTHRYVTERRLVYLAGEKDEEVRVIRFVFALVKLWCHSTHFVSFGTLCVLY